SWLFRPFMFQSLLHEKIRFFIFTLYTIFCSSTENKGVNNLEILAKMQCHASSKHLEIKQPDQATLFLPRRREP
ncbi:hypothetical protein OFB61_25740, partial [Escherichia coli]|nr:hypothetical protein [Escherichia coli]